MLVASQPKLDGIDLAIDRWCVELAHALQMTPTAEHKLAVLSVALLLLYALQSISQLLSAATGQASPAIASSSTCGAQLFTHLQRLPHAFFDRNPSGAIVSRVLNDVQQAQELVSSALIDVWMDAVSLGLVVVVLFAMDWRLALVALCIAPVVGDIHAVLLPRIKAVSHRMQETLESISGEVQERVAGAATIKSFGREDHEVSRFRTRSEHLSNARSTRSSSRPGRRCSSSC